ncbi:hypothetical protein [Xanthomonas cucurbitae]|uniref:Uncharacterized protein n=1 Tax=Xanthomonas cucurbitae TaxID=56453 RepID=A0ABY7YFI1_9XANT|nr:hypothetical protein [Xanthomonas cucurbitae]WDM68771.1 hypothetical protein K6981_05695 [Xanthomonas cucurbitae]WDM72643.1 hypothetical protein K6978_05685 [Xanthomonas cucurbitae]WDM78122.1 hypothetical protein K6980_13100 [Xanthomonas cucurbitae]WDM81802.1 hypothetical protein K6979_13105 [Xanthomonas cucurbitae]
MYLESFSFSSTGVGHSLAEPAVDPSGHFRAAHVGTAIMQSTIKAALIQYAGNLRRECVGPIERALIVVDFFRSLIEHLARS